MILWLTAVALAGDGVDAHGFHLLGRAGDPTGYVRLVDPAEHLRGVDVALLLDHGNRPLTEVLPGGREPIIRTLTTANLALGWSPTPSLRLDATWPVHALGTGPTGSFAASGDARIGAAWTLPVAPGPLSFAVEPVLWLPTGAATRNVGSPGITAGVLAAGELEVGRFGAVLNLGGRLGATGEERNLKTGPGPLLGAGVRVDPVDDFGLGIELTAQGTTGWRDVPVELMLTARSRYQPGTWLVAGLAVGLNDAVGSTSWRLVLGAAVGQEPEPVSDPAVVIDSPCVGEDCPCVGEDCPCVGEDCPCVGEDCPCVGEDCPCVGEDCPCVGEDCPCVGDGCEDGLPLAYLDTDEDRIVVMESVFFEEDRADILATSYPFLEAVIAVLAAHPEVDHLLIEGHTNDHGSDAYNLALGQERAERVAAWLVAQGVDETRLIPKGYGYRRPLVPHTHPDARRINRRVEFTVLRPDEDPDDVRLPGEQELPPQ